MVHTRTDPERDASTGRYIKKYPNRRLYDTHTSSYITLVDVKRLVWHGETFRVWDVQRKRDCTRSILMQIILDEETGGRPMFTLDVLQNLIRHYGNGTQDLMGTYLDNNVQVFNDVQAALVQRTARAGRSGEWRDDLRSYVAASQQALRQAGVEHDDGNRLAAAP